MDHDGDSRTQINLQSKRVRLARDMRRSQILDAAQALFVARGWDAVTIADVLAEAGISKGGFYHHFSAKEDLLDALVERFTERAMDGTAGAREAEGDALARFNTFVDASNRWRAEHGPELRFFLDVMLQPGNETQFARINAASAEVTLPVLRGLIEEGACSGRFDVPDAGLVAETILALGHGRRAALRAAVKATDAGDLDAAALTLEARMAGEARLIDRLLGLPPGSVVLSEAGKHREMLAAIAAPCGDRRPRAPKPTRTPKPGSERRPPC
ncbi:TetR/AcrR family transcriptional regulator [uncultured Jannaschia sp.]|uniref:TetR/AcrR family transcriptional regulator n=1 Tax=uncultured Jannaschia sp. TaxID=293347 RepID=UPI002609CFE9|nr:TetR/AcrR family transcriptional regulator [uncultured Jannaschia sp.]